MAEATVRTPHEITPENAPEARGTLLGEVAEWLGRTAVLVDMIRQDFEGDSFYQNTLVSSSGPDGRILSHMYTTRRIVLPEQPLTPLTRAEPIVRQAAVDLTLYYDYDGQRKESDKLPFPTPTPHEVHIQGLAIAAHHERGNYRHSDNVSISGRPLNISSWYATEVGAGLPVRRSKRQDDSLCNFEVMREMRPDDPQLAEAVSFHREKLVRYVGLFGSIAAALQTPELNPKK